MASRRPWSRPWSRYMLRKLPQRAYFARLLASTASSASAAMLCGCQTSATSDITGALGDKAETSRRPTLGATLESHHERYRANPKDVDAAIQYAKALRASGQRAQAVACLNRPPSPTEQQDAPRGLWAGTGGQRQFPAGLRRAGSRPQPDDPDWRISQRKEPYSINSPGSRKRGSTTLAR